MKNLTYLFSIVLLILTSCSQDNIETTDINFLPEDPVIVNIENPLKYNLRATDPTITSGTAYENIGETSTLYLVASDDVEVECPGGLASSFQAPGDFFHFMFINFNGGDQVIDARFNTVIDGNEIGVFNLNFIDCITESIQVDYEIVNDRMVGTFTGEFFYFNDEFVEPFDSCVNFISAGILEASFNCPLVNCN